jgi:hypothetical protein
MMHARAASRVQELPLGDRPEVIPVLPAIDLQIRQFHPPRHSAAALSSEKAI